MRVVEVVGHQRKFCCGYIWILKIFKLQNK
jgi:hypothetical protein